MWLGTGRAPHLSLVGVGPGAHSKCWHDLGERLFLHVFYLETN